jgi:hypothetical protein
VRASTQDVQNPSWAVHPVQMSVVVTGKSASARKLRTLEEPRKETTMSLFVLSVATKPVTSVRRELENGK